MLTKVYYCFCSVWRWNTILLIYVLNKKIVDPPFNYFNWRFIEFLECFWILENTVHWRLNYKQEIQFPLLSEKCIKMYILIIIMFKSNVSRNSLSAYCYSLGVTNTSMCFYKLYISKHVWQDHVIFKSIAHF